MNSHCCSDNLMCLFFILKVFHSVSDLYNLKSVKSKIFNLWNTKSLI